MHSKSTWLLILLISLGLAGCTAPDSGQSSTTPSSSSSSDAQYTNVTQIFHLVESGISGPSPIGNRAVEASELLIQNCVGIEHPERAGISTAHALLTRTTILDQGDVTLGAWTLFRKSSDIVEKNVIGRDRVSLDFDYANATIGKDTPIAFSFWAFLTGKPAGAAVRDEYDLQLTITAMHPELVTFNPRGVCY